MNKSLFIPGLMLALSLAGGCSRHPAPKGGGPVPVLTARAFTTNVPVLIEPAPVGHVLPISTVNVRPQVGGVISEVVFREGQEVAAGELLLKIDPRPMQAALEQARAALQRDLAQLQNAQIEFDREKKLFDQKLVAQDVFDTSKASFDALAGTVAADRAAVTNAELNLAYTEIHAPIEGRTGALQIHEGNVVKAPDDVLVTINEIHPIYAEFAVPERYLPVIQRQMRAHSLAVSASFDNLQGEPPRGELTFVDNAVDQMTGTIRLRSTFPNTNGTLWPGQFVRLELQLDELTNAVVVPSQAVQEGQNGQIVYVVKSDNTAEVRPVKTQLFYRGLAVITAGVNPGETVVTDGQLRLRSGLAVNDRTSKPTEAAGGAAEAASNSPVAVP